MIDTHKTHQNLSAAGFSPVQVEALLELAREVQDDLVTKDFLRAELAQGLGNLKTELIYWIVGTVGLAVALLVVGAILLK